MPVFIGDVLNIFELLLNFKLLYTGNLGFY